MKTLLIATRNAHKIREIRAILGGQFQFLALDDFPNAPEIIENKKTFAGNAEKKAMELAKWISANSTVQRINNPVNLVLADDSGLEVDALDGAPGVHSARFAAMDSGKSGNSSDTDNNLKLSRLIENVPAGKRAARFRCVLALTPVLNEKTENASPVCYADESELQTQLFEGVCEGKIILGPRGKNGFGYDPFFVPGGFQKTFAELGDEIKNQISHRSKALEKLKNYLSKLPS